MLDNSGIKGNIDFLSMCEELVEDDVLSQSHFSKLQHRIYYVKDTHVYAFLFDAEKTPVWDQHYTQLQISPT